MSHISRVNTHLWETGIEFLPEISLLYNKVNSVANELKHKGERAEIPVCSSLGIVGGAVLIDRLDSEFSRPVGTPVAVGGGVTAESWT